MRQQPIRVAIIIVAGAVHAAVSAQPRPPAQSVPMAPRFVDPVNGLTLDQVVQRALAQEPGLRAARTQIDAARGMSRQASLKPNPTISFMQQNEPAGLDAETRVDVQWPLDLYRKAGRVNVAERQVVVAEHVTSERERLLASEVRTKVGEVLTAVRDLSVLDELVAAMASQEALLAARAVEGAIPPLERDLMRVELRRLEADRIIQAGHTEYLAIELKRLMGLHPETPLALQQDLDALVQTEIAVEIPGVEHPPAGRADVQAAQARIVVAEARIDQAQREGRLDLNLVATYMRVDAGFPQRGFGPGGDIKLVRGQFNYLAGGVMVSIPLRDRRQGDLLAAQAQRAGAEAELEAARLAADSEVAATRTRDRHARQALALYSTETRNLARRNLDIVQQTYEAGRMTLFDVINERRRYLDTERAYTGALREAYDARQALKTALGEVR
jgi:cobalt-zinc-cadmium efflux system outer membrane protein